MLIQDQETTIDFLNYEAISRTVVKLIKENRDGALTIGIHGDWGAGKSSVLKMIELEACKDKSVSCLWFNGWTFQGFDDAKIILIESIIQELCKQRSGIGKVKELGASLLRRVDWLRLAKRTPGILFSLATGIPAPDQIQSLLGGIGFVRDNLKSLSRDELDGKLEEVISYLKPNDESRASEQVHRFRDEFEKLISEARIDQIIILIDDLDRCLPSTTIETLEALRLFLFVPRTAFVIGADEGMIEYAVREHFPDFPASAGSLQYSRNYLEKLVQVPFRIPALGAEETRIYVTLQLIASLVGENDPNFQKLLQIAKAKLNQPWLGVGLPLSEVEVVAPRQKDALVSAYTLAQQLGPILAEGTKGNPRQIKRFLNALAVRQGIATVRGFGDSINRSVLAKLMLVERFQPTFYDFLAQRAMLSSSGVVAELGILEATKGETEKSEIVQEILGDNDDVTPQLSNDSWLPKGLDKDWLRRWLAIDPLLGSLDLRPYVFVSRDKRMLTMTSQIQGLDSLIVKLQGPDLIVRSVEPEVKSLSPKDAEHVFEALKIQVLRHGTFITQPPGFNGLSVVAKHHDRFQKEVISLVGNISAKQLGLWVIKGWNEMLTSGEAKAQLEAQMQRWAAQKDNGMLSNAAAQALRSKSKGIG